MKSRTLSATSLILLAPMIVLAFQAQADQVRGDENAAVNIEMEGARLLAGSGYIGVTPVEFAASALKIASTKVADCEAGTFHVFPRGR